MQCIKCGAEIPDGSAYCNVCGKKQTTEKRRYKKRANGAGSIYKLPGNRAKPFQARKNGVTVGTYKTRNEAEKALARLTDQEITDKYNLTFQQVYDLWKPVAFRKISKSHRDDYTGAYKRASALHGRKFRSLKKSDYMAEIVKLEEAGYAESTISKSMQLFSSLSKWAMSEEIVHQNHAAFLETVATQKKERKPFSDAQLKAIKDCTLKPAAILRIIIATGCRPIDLFTAKLADCHGDYFISGSKSETGRDRCIAVSDYGLADYQTLLMMATLKPGSEKLIDGYKGNHVYANWEKRDYAELRDALNLGDMTPYAGRHTFVSKASAAGMPQDILRRQVGHKDIHTTDAIYKHYNDDVIIEATRAVKF